METQEKSESNIYSGERLLRIAEEKETESSYHWVDSKNLNNSFTLVGKNTYVIGLECGRFEGRWNGIWSLPIKVAERVHFAISDGTKLFFLQDHAVEFATKLSHVERTYDISELDLRIKELLFIPENRQSLCWRFIVKKKHGSRDSATSDAANLRFLAQCEFNLMWEVKQAGEQYRVKKEVILYNEDNYSVVAKHYRHADWIAIFGANREPRRKHLGFDKFNSPSDSDLLPGSDKPTYGSVMLEYDVKWANSDNAEERDRFETDICLTGGAMSYLEAIREFNDTMLNFEPLVLEKTTLYKNFLANTVEILSPENSLTKAFKWSKVNLHMLEHYQAGFGTGTFAGLPHFAIYFGRDICWSTLGLLSIGDFDGARENLNLLARFQAPANGEDMLREPYYRGEIPHEIRTEGTVYYYSADATPLFVIAARSYLDWTKDSNFTRFIYNNIIRAIEWSLDADRDGDGLIEHGPEGFLIDTTWMDSYYRGKSALDVQAIFCKALYDGSDIAFALGDESRAQDWREKASRIKNLILEKYWNKDSGFFYDTIESSGEPNRSITINSVVPVLLGLTDHQTSSSVLSKIESLEFMTDWGVRTRSKKDPEYDPRSYQKGGVWPFCTGWVTLSEFQQGMYNEGLSSIQRFVTGLEMGSNYFKEVLYGDMPPTGQHPVQPTGCFIQAWSAGMFLTSAIQGLLGISPSSNTGAADFRIEPFLSGQWKDLVIRNIHVGQNIFDLTLNTDLDRVKIKLYNHGPDSAIIQSGFVLPSSASTVRMIEGSQAGVEELSQTKVANYLKANFKTRLQENETGAFSFDIS